MFNKTDIVILAGGYGTRFKTISKKLPKPLVEINQLPLLNYVLMNISKYKFKKIYILAGYKGNLIKKKFHKKKINLTSIEVIVEKKPKGTAKAIFCLRKKINNNFILLNGDTIFKIKLDFFLKKSLTIKGTLGSIALCKNNLNNYNKKLNNLKITNNLIQFSKNGKLMNGGVYFFKKKIFSFIKKDNYSLENEVIQKLIYKKKIGGLKFNNYFIDVGTPKTFFMAKKQLKKEFKKPAAILDRDGVINYDFGYVHNFKNFVFRNNVIKGLRYLIKNNYYIFIVTNQAGIAKKKFKETDFYNLHDKIDRYFKSQKIYTDDIRYCPFHTEAKIKKYKVNSNLRKPKIGMIKELQKNWLIDAKKSFVIGDKKTDQLMAKSSKITFKYASNNFYKDIKILHNQ